MDLTPRMMADIRAAFAVLDPLKAGHDDPFKRAQAISAEMEADYQQKLARWERDAPKRAAALAAMEAAEERRRAQFGGPAFGRPVRLGVAAALDWNKPERRVIF
jgi:hypothetical protein